MIVDMRKFLHIYAHMRKRSKHMKRIGIQVMRMDRRIRHGKMMSSYEEAIMDLMIKVEESERYLQKYRSRDDAIIVVENGEEEHYPSFAMGKKEKEDDVQIREFFKQGEIVEDHRIPCERAEGTIVKLTLWEWVEARKKGIVNVILLSAAFFLQIYIVWTDMNEVSILILSTLKYMCILLLVLKFSRWIISGEMHRFLNEDC